MFDLKATQEALQEFGVDAWLLHDFRGSNVLARRILDLDGKPTTSRRFYYLIPSRGEPIRLVHRIETGALDHLPGEKRVYLRWQELEAALAALVAERPRVAMEYSPRNNIPYVSRVDAGTAEVIRGAGAEIVSSGDLIQRFEATWDDDQWAMHKDAEKVTTSAYDLAWKFIADKTRNGGSTSEYEVQQVVMKHFHEHHCTTYSPPIVGANANSGDPHFETTKERDTPIKKGDFVLLDLWAKMDKPRAVYSDLTRVAYVGETVPSIYEEIFAIVAQARDAAVAIVKNAYAAGQELRGWQVDDACRAVIDKSGHGHEFVHRTGHNIGQEVHGNGANMDNLETREERLVMKRTCFSVEPGIYRKDFGVRSEINVFVDKHGEVHVTGGPVQQKVVALLAT